MEYISIVFLLIASIGFAWYAFGFIRAVIFLFVIACLYGLNALLVHYFHYQGKWFFVAVLLLTTIIMHFINWKKKKGKRK